MNERGVVPGFVVQRSAFNSLLFGFITGVLGKMVLHLNTSFCESKTLEGVDATMVKLFNVEAVR